jgi:hypothetical protein
LHRAERIEFVAFKVNDKRKKAEPVESTDGPEALRELATRPPEGVCDLIERTLAAYIAARSPKKKDQATGKEYVPAFSIPHSTHPIVEEIARTLTSALQRSSDARSWVLTQARDLITGDVLVLSTYDPKTGWASDREVTVIARSAGPKGHQVTIRCRAGGRHEDVVASADFLFHAHRPAAELESL